MKPTIVLVHGAFADASEWQPVITLLQEDGYRVVALQNSLESLSDDVETTKRVIDAQDGPVVVVGHSYGGAVISGAAAGNRTSKPSCSLPRLRQSPARRRPHSSTSTLPTSAERLSQTLPASTTWRSKFHDVFAATSPPAKLLRAPPPRSPYTIRSSGSR